MQGDGHCVGCSAHLRGRGRAHLFCTAQCREIARVVRDARRQSGLPAPDATVPADPTADASLRRRVAYLLVSRHRQHATLAGPLQMLQVRARDGLRCAFCPSVAVALDHTRGAGSGLQDLRLVCRTCHGRVVRAQMRAMHDRDPVIQEMLSVLHRVTAATPERPCDDEQAWASLWRRPNERHVDGPAG